MSAASSRSKVRRPTKTPERPRVVGLVCEGSTDVVVLRAVIESVLGEVDVRVLVPLVDELDRQLPGTSSGWSQVRAWCERSSELEELFTPEIGDPLELLVIAIDLDIAIRAGLEKSPENLSGYDAKGLCDLVKGWLPERLPPRVIIAIPVMSIEAWVLGALFPRLPHPEHQQDPAGVLVEKGKIEMGRSGPWKRVAEYRSFAVAVRRNLKAVRRACAEADRFAKKLENLAGV